MGQVFGVIPAGKVPPGMRAARLLTRQRRVRGRFRRVDQVAKLQRREQLRVEDPAVVVKAHIR